MKYSIFAVAALGLAACGGAPTTAELCTEMVDGDPEAADELARDGVDMAGFCTCLGTTVDAMSEEKRAKHVSVMTAVSALRKANSVGVEEAAETLEDELRSESNPHDFTEDDFQATGRLLGEVGDNLSENGSCD